MKSFGLVTEGITDQVVILRILSGFFGSNNIPPNPLQPRPNASGGWTKVLDYCADVEFREAFRILDYVIVHIDTDTSEEYGVSHHEGETELSPDALVQKIVGKLVEKIGADFYSKNKEKIIFAVSVHSIECWLLPLHCPNKAAIRSKTTGCLNALNRELKKDGYTIDPNAKGRGNYDRASAGYSDKKTLMGVYEHNPSLKIFIDDLSSRNINLEEEVS